MFTPAVLVNRATSLLMTICLLKSVSIFPGLGWLKLDVAELLKNKSIKVPLVIYQALNLRLPGSINLQPNLYKNMLLHCLQMKAKNSVLCWSKPSVSPLVLTGSLIKSQAIGVFRWLLIKTGRSLFF